MRKAEVVAERRVAERRVNANKTRDASISTLDINRQDSAARNWPSIPRWYIRSPARRILLEWLLLRVSTPVLHTQCARSLDVRICSDSPVSHGSVPILSASPHLRLRPRSSQVSTAEGLHLPSAIAESSGLRHTGRETSTPVAALTAFWAGDRIYDGSWFVVRGSWSAGAGWAVSDEN